MGTVTITQKDYSNEVTRTRFRVREITDAAGELTAIDAIEAALLAAVQGVTKGTVTQHAYNMDATKLGNAAPGDQDAQRERKIVVFFEDTTTFDVYSNEIGVADVAALTINPNTDEIDITAGAMATLVTAMEANVLSKAGNAINVTRAELVGRNL